MLMKATEQRNDNFMSSILNMFFFFRCVHFKLKMIYLQFLTNNCYYNVLYSVYEYVCILFITEWPLILDEIRDIRENSYIFRKR